MKTILALLLLLSCSAARGQNVIWEKLLAPASSIRQGADVIPVSDGGFIAAGQVGSGTGPAESIYLVHTGGDGTVVWEKTMPGHDSTVAAALYPAPEGGFYIIGWTHKSTITADALAHAWIAKLDIGGELLWERVYGEGRIRGADQTSDHGFILTGERDSAALLVKIDSIGGPVWERTFHHGIYASGASVRPRFAGGYIIAGTTVGSPSSDAGMLLIRTNSRGDSLWAGTYKFRFVSREEGCCAEEVPWGFFLTGVMRMSLNEADPTGWLFMSGIDPQGGVEWTQSVPRIGTATDSIGVNEPHMSRKLSGGSVVICGASGLDVSTMPFLLQVGGDGTIQWLKMLGDSASGAGVASAFRPLPDGGFIVTGTKLGRLMLMRIGRPASGVEENVLLPVKMDLSQIALPAHGDR